MVKNKKNKRICANTYFVEKKVLLINNYYHFCESEYLGLLFMWKEFIIPRAKCFQYIIAIYLITFPWIHFLKIFKK